MLWRIAPTVLFDSTAQAQKDACSLGWTCKMLKHTVQKQCISITVCSAFTQMKNQNDKHCSASQLGHIVQAGGTSTFILSSYSCRTVSNVTDISSGLNLRRLTFSSGIGGQQQQRMLYVRIPASLCTNLFKLRQVSTVCIEEKHVLTLM